MTRVLVIDDDASIQRSVALALRGDGYEVHAALSGQDALDLIEGCAPDLILLDLMMPGMDGSAFRAAQLRLERGVAIPFVLMTAGHDGAAVAEALRATAFVAKPFDLADLLAIVRRCAGAQ